MPTHFASTIRDSRHTNLPSFKQGCKHFFNFEFIIREHKDDNPWVAKFTFYKQDCQHVLYVPSEIKSIQILAPSFKQGCQHIWDKHIKRLRALHCVKKNPYTKKLINQLFVTICILGNQIVILATAFSFLPLQQNCNWTSSAWRYFLLKHAKFAQKQKVLKHKLCLIN